MPHKFSGFCRNMPATVTPMVALLTLLSLTKPSVIYSTWCKESLLKPKKKDLRDKKFVKRSSRIAPHSPFISPNELIRSSCRIRRLIEVGFNVKYPIILDARHPFVKLFLEHTHVKHCHQGVEYLRSILQEHYTILKLRSSLRSIKAHCLRCREFQAVTMQPIMSDLPKERLAYRSPPFTNTGVDYFGPFYVTVRRTTEKRWGFLFTCLTTRAVHVEIVTSMDTSSCVMGVERFVSRRTMALTVLERRKNSEKVLKNGTLSTLQLSSLTKV